MEFRSSPKPSKGKVKMNAMVENDAAIEPHDNLKIDDPLDVTIDFER